MNNDASEFNVPAREPVSPDILAWARQTLDKEQIVEQIREIEKTGGLTLEDFIHEIEELARPSWANR